MQVILQTSGYQAMPESVGGVKLSLRAFAGMNGGVFMLLYVVYHPADQGSVQLHAKHSKWEKAVQDLQGFGDLEGDERVVGLAPGQAWLTNDREGEQRVKA